MLPMKHKHYFILILIISSIQCSLISQLEDQSIIFGLDNFDKNELNNKTVKLVALKNGNTFRIESNTNNKNQLQQGDIMCASIDYQKKLNETGWDIVYLETHKQCNQEEQMQCAGFLEGLATKQAISDFIYNISESRKSTDEQYKSFFSNIYNNLLRNANSSQNKKQEKYWNTAKLFLLQLIGMKNGFNSIEKTENQKLELWKISLPNIDGQADEIDTLISSNDKNSNASTNMIFQKINLRKTLKHKRRNSLSDWERVMKKSRCSAFFKILTSQKNGEAILNDIFATHSTWEPYSSMNRIYKLYNLPNFENKHEWIQMSSYPGAISSTDDFIIKQGKFLTTETSIATIREDIIPSLNSQDLDIPDFIRIQSATSLSSTAKEWAQYMKQYGKVKMYSSEWMILDIQKLQKGKSVPKDTFILLSSSYEQQIIKDMTQQLIEDTYFASFNNPQLIEIRDYLGYTEQEKENEFLSYKNDPRNQIFEFFQSKATSIEKVKWMIEHNSYQKDKVNGEPTFDSPFAALGARGDLNNDQEVYYGAVDAKVVNLKKLQNFEVDAISGPSHQEQSIFVWKGNSRHQGQPTKWDFDWINISLKKQKD